MGGLWHCFTHMKNPKNEIGEMRLELIWLRKFDPFLRNLDVLNLEMEQIEE